MKKNMKANTSEKTYTQNQDGFGHKSKKIKESMYTYKT